MSDFSFSGAFDDLAGGLTDSLSRRIDNELNSDYLPSPQQATREAPVVKTADNELGRAKFAGTGGGFVDNVPTAVWIGGGVAVIGLIAFMALK